MSNFQKTTSENLFIASATQKQKEETEATIKTLEEMEMRMLNQMQTTLARKQAALQTLDSKSKALKKNIEPRNAYKLTNRSDMQSENGAPFDPNSSRISI